MPELKSLWLYGNKIANFPADIFKNNTELVYLSLYKNNIANLPADIFKYNPKLVSLSGTSRVGCTGNAFGASGALAIDRHDRGHKQMNQSHEHYVSICALNLPHSAALHPYNM